jgi:GNAT superfamily N-acetyltransferase
VNEYGRHGSMTDVANLLDAAGYEVPPGEAGLRQALRLFQARNGLAVTGRPDSGTLSLLNRIKSNAAAGVGGDGFTAFYDPKAQGKAGSKAFQRKMQQAAAWDKLKHPRDRTGQWIGVDDFAGPMDRANPQSVQDNYTRRAEWREAARAAVAHGELDPAEAERLGLSSIDGQPSSKIKPLPAKLYHATTALSKVKETGLKTRNDLRAESGSAMKGTLGGGSDDTISFTDSPDAAHHVARQLHVVRAAAAGDVTFEDLMDSARMGEDADGPFHEEFAASVPQDVLNRARGEEEALHPYGAQPDDSVWAEGWQPDLTTEFMAPNGRPAWRRFTKTLPDADRNDARAALAIDYLKARAAAGGEPYVGFVGGGMGHLADVHPDEIGVVHAEPVGKAHGYEVKGEAVPEYRALAGSSVKVTHAEGVKPREETQPVAAQPADTTMAHVPTLPQASAPKGPPGMPPGPPVPSHLPHGEAPTATVNDALNTELDALAAQAQRELAGEGSESFDPRDSAALAALWAEAREAGFTGHELQVVREAIGPGHTMWGQGDRAPQQGRLVRDAAGKPLGVVTFSHHDAAGTTTVHSLATRSGQGAGRKLMTEVAREAAAKGHTIGLSADSGSEGFYAKLGFKKGAQGGSRMTLDAEAVRKLAHDESKKGAGSGNAVR